MAASSVDLPTSFEQPPARREQVRAHGRDLPGGCPASSHAFLPARGVDLSRAPAARTSRPTSPGCSPAGSPPTAANRYRALRVFDAWPEDEGEIPTDPMLKMKPPRVPDQPAPVLTEECYAGCWPPAPAGTSKLAATAPSSLLLLDYWRPPVRDRPACAWAM